MTMTMQLARSIDRTRKAALRAVIRNAQRAVVMCVPIMDAKWVLLHPTLGMIGAYTSDADLKAVRAEHPGSYGVAARGFKLAKKRDAGRIR